MIRLPKKDVNENTVHHMIRTAKIINKIYSLSISNHGEDMFSITVDGTCQAAHTDLAETGNFWPTLTEEEVERAQDANAHLPAMEFHHLFSLPFTSRF